MKRTKRVIQHDFPGCSVPDAELRKIFRDLRERRIAAEHRAKARTAPSPAPLDVRGRRAAREHEVAT